MLCHHYKTAPANWRERRQRARERQEKGRERVTKYRAQVRENKEALAVLRHEAREKRNAAKTDAQRKKVRLRYAKRTETAKRRIETAEARLERALAALEKSKTKDAVTAKKRTWNLGTSLKSYIDPRVVYQWGLTVDYDVLERYYPKALRRKFAWVREGEPSGE